MLCLGLYERLPCGQVSLLLCVCSSAMVLVVGHGDAQETSGATSVSMQARMPTENTLLCVQEGAKPPGILVSA